MKLSTNVNFSLSVELSERKYQVDISKPLSIAIAVDFTATTNNGQAEKKASQPNHFGATYASSNAMQVDGFIGDTEQGGSCNVNELRINPHCNGTHTETIGHICDASDLLSKTIANISLAPLMPAVLISVNPTVFDNTTQDQNTLFGESYNPALVKGDRVITRAALSKLLTGYQDQQLTSLIVRTLPNHENKCVQAYSSLNQPPFFSREAILYLNERGVSHLLLDTPSLDRLHDDGLLTCHHLFWQVAEGKHQATKESLSNKTITEMAFIDNKIKDGFYFINLQMPAFITDAAPSRPVLYACEKL